MNTDHKNKIERFIDSVFSNQPAMSTHDSFSLFLKIPCSAFSCQLASELFRDTQISNFEDKTVLEIRVDEDVFRAFESSDIFIPLQIYKNDETIPYFAEEVQSIGDFIKAMKDMNVQLYFKEFFHFNDEVRADLVRTGSDAFPESLINFQ